MNSFARYFLAPGLLFWSLTAGPAALAQSSIDQPSPSCPEVTWNQLEPQAQEFVKKGDFLTSAAHNPRVKDYYLASDMYAKAATLFEQGSYQYMNAIKTCPSQAEQFQPQHEALSKQAQKYIFKSFQANHVGANRESRGLL